MMNWYSPRLFNLKGCSFVSLFLHWLAHEKEILCLFASQFPQGHYHEKKSIFDSKSYLSVSGFGDGITRRVPIALIVEKLAHLSKHFPIQVLACYKSVKTPVI